jgi:hypothetical protein
MRRDNYDISLKTSHVISGKAKTPAHYSEREENDSRGSADRWSIDLIDHFPMDE